MILGSQSEEYKDWNGDGAVDDPGDGYGLLLNGENLGYIQGTFTHAGLALTSPDATQNMLTEGQYVRDCATNLDEWTPQLHDRLRAILNTSFDSPELEGMVREAVRWRTRSGTALTPMAMRRSNLFRVKEGL